MTEVTTQGPSGNAEWRVVIVGAESTRHQRLRFLPDAGNDALEASGSLAVGYALPDQPMLALNASGSPIFSLTLILDRQPQPHEDSIAPLVRQGILNFEVTLALEPALLESLRCRDKVIYRSIFASNVEFALVSGDGLNQLGSATTTGSDAHVALHANLNADSARAVLAALNSQPSGLQVLARLRYPVVAPARQLNIRASWAAIHDYLSIHVSNVSDFDGTTLRRQFSEMIDAGVINVNDETGQALSGASAIEMYGAFLSLAGVVTRRLTLELPSASDENRYALRERPHAMFNLNYSESINGNQEDEVMLSIDLCDFVGGQLPRDEWDRYIHLVAPDYNGSITPAPRRVQAKSKRHSLTQTTAHPARMAATENRLQSVALTIAPHERSTSSLLANASLRPAVGEMVGRHPSWTWPLDDLIIVDQVHSIVAMSMPVVDNTRADFWHDKDDRQLYWYAPEFVISSPSPTAAPADSPFLFEYETTGVTADGKPALLASVRFKIDMIQSEEVRHELRRLGNVRSGMVTIQNLSVALEVPFVDEHGVTRTHRFPADVTCQGDTIIATVELLNDWARLCYGALAMENFQRQPVRLQIGYSFPAYVPISKTKAELVFGGKTAITPVVYNTSEVNKINEAVFLDASTASLHVPMGVLKLKHEPLLNRAEGKGMAVAGAHMVSTTAHSTSGAQIKLSKAIATSGAVRPQLAVATSILTAGKCEYTRRSIARQESIDAFFSCASLGVFYRKRCNGTTQAIGCRDALKLGQTIYRQYEDMVALRHAKYRVYRSLQQPGRFLVLPTQYAITRHMPGQSMAYRPCAILYSLIDPADATNNRVVFEASMQPDIPPFELLALTEALAAYATSPILEYPTEVMNDADYTWAVSAAISEPTAIELGDSIRVAIDIDFTGGLLLMNMLSHEGIHGIVHFKLGDGTTLRSTLALDLNNITGPWQSGPVSAMAMGGGVEITNHIEQSVTVNELHRYVGRIKTEAIVVNTTLNGGQSHVVPLTDAGGELVPVYTRHATGTTNLQESRVFVEDVISNVVFFVQLNYANHNLQRLDIKTRLAGVDGVQTVPLSGDPPVGSVNITLPLTDYLSTQNFQYQVTKVFNDGTRVSTPWLDWDLQEDVNIVSVSWDMISA